MDPPAVDYENAKRSLPPPAVSLRERREAIGSRYIVLLLAISFMCIVTSFMVNRHLSSYFKLISTTIDQPYNLDNAALNTSKDKDGNKYFEGE